MPATTHKLGTVNAGIHAACTAQRIKAHRKAFVSLYRQTPDSILAIEMAITRWWMMLRQNNGPKLVVWRDADEFNQFCGELSRLLGGDDQAVMTIRYIRCVASLIACDLSSEIDITPEVMSSWFDDAAEYEGNPPNARFWTIFALREYMFGGDILSPIS